MRFMNVSQYLRSLVSGVNTPVRLANGQHVTAINFDNAATTPPFCAVIREIVDFAPWYSSVHRGAGYKSVFTSELYEQGREAVRQFVNADPQTAVIFTKNTTESINVVAYILAREDREQVVLSTDMEHLANDLPWRDKFTLDYVGIDEYGRLSIQDLEAKLLKYKGKVRLVAVTGASNVTGYLNPIHKIAAITHKHGAQILIDGAQMVPHVPMDMKPCDSPEHIDYLAFSGHKMYAPFGAGVLIGPKPAFDKGYPVYKGGGAVKLVSHQHVGWDEAPNRYEAGTPNMMGVLALMTAIKTINGANMNVIHKYEQHLIDYAIQGLSTIPGLKIYSCDDGQADRVSLISFNVEDIHHSLLAEILSQEAGIASRNGLFCAHPYVARLLNLSNEDFQYYQTHEDAAIPGMVRISFGLYNTCREIDILLNLLANVVKCKDYFIKKYAHVLRCNNTYTYC